MTLSTKALAEELDRTPQSAIDDVDRERPRQRVDCAGGELRPCPFVSCKHHLYIDVNPETGSIKYNFPGIEVWDMKESCSLDVAAQGGVTLEEVGEVVNLTRERVRQIETRGLIKLRIYEEVDEDCIALPRAIEESGDE